MILDSRKGAKIRKEVEIPFTQISNFENKKFVRFEWLTIATFGSCSKKKLISTRLTDLSWTQIAINFIYQQDFTDETD